MTTSHRIEVDHTPGGSPVGKSAAAPIYRTVNIRAELLGAVEHSGEWLDAKTALSVCRAAAAMGMRNADKYTAENRVDAAADALSRLWAKNGNTPPVCGCGGPVRYRTVQTNTHPGVMTGRARTLRCLRCSGRPLRGNVKRTPVLPVADAIPADSCTFTHALNLVANFRRALDAQRVRDAQHCADSAIERDFSPSPELELAQRTTAPDAIGTPAGARRTAVFLLRSAGLLSNVVEHGPLWTLAYTAARCAVLDVSTGEIMGQSDVARELELTANTHRSHLNRAAKRLAELGFTPNDWREALDIALPFVGKSHGNAAGLPLSVTGDSVRDDWRTAPGQRTANTAAVVATAPVLPVYGPTPAPRTAPADWTAYLSPVTAGRLARAAELRDARAAARNDAERTALKSAAGL